MLTTIVLRFRDLVASTIPEHQTMIIEAKHVWWGWWQKTDEADHLTELRQVKAHLERKPLIIGLYDRSRPAFFKATLLDCAFREDKTKIESPNPATTPSYYRGAKLPAWFRLTSIEPVSRETFAQLFISIPSGDDTFFPVASGAAEQQSRPITSTNDFPLLKGKAIVHLSDLHFGSDFGYPSVKEPGKENLLEILATDIKKQAGEDVGLLVVSGDITSRGDGSPLFNTGKPFLHELRRRLGLDSDKVIIIPGNHDISFKDFALTYDHEAAFNDFISLFYGAPRKQIQLLRFLSPPDQFIEVLTINSVKLRNKETANYGWVDWNAHEVFLASNPKPNADTLRIAVMHHHLISAVKEERLPDSQYPYASVSVTLNSGSVIEGLQRHGFSLVLHGHQHTPAVNRISRGRPREDDTIGLDGLNEPLYVVAGGSAGVAASRIDGDVRDNTYGILWLQNDSLKLKVRGFNPSGSVRSLYSADLGLK